MWDTHSIPEIFFTALAFFMEEKLVLNQGRQYDVLPLAPQR
jgi:hypothetical protein